VRVKIVFGRGVGEVMRARWIWWRTESRSFQPSPLVINAHTEVVQ
jgi:hypothetical protein